MNSLIFAAFSRILFGVMLVVSVYVLYRGHNEPGGGFVGGLIAAAGFATLALARGVEVARATLRFEPMTVIGFGILAIARHGAGVGGVGVVALILQKSRGWNAGRTQMACDVLILLASLPILNAERFGLSVLSAAAINAVLFVNHRPGRYIGH